MQILEAMWALKMVACSEEDKTAIRNVYKLAYPKRKREIDQKATNNDKTAKDELKYYWNDPIFASDLVYMFTGKEPYS